MTEQNTAIDQRQKNHRTIVIIFAMGIVPIVLAAIANWNDWFPEIKLPPPLINPPISICRLLINDPPLTRCISEFSGFDDFSKNNLSELSGHWLLVNVIPKEHCNASCLKAILDVRQIRLMLSRDIPRTRRVVMVLKEPNPNDAKLWWLKETLLWSLNTGEGKDEAQTKRDAERYKLFLSENQNVDELIGELIAKAHTQKTVAEVKTELPLTSDLIKVIPSASLLKKLTALSKGEILDGTLYIIDPLGNIMMQYPPGFDPYKVTKDLMQLLKASQIG